MAAHLMARTLHALRLTIFLYHQQIPHAFLFYGKIKTNRNQNTFEGHCQTRTHVNIEIFISKSLQNKAPNLPPHNHNNRTIDNKTERQWDERKKIPDACTGHLCHTTLYTHFLSIDDVILLSVLSLLRICWCCCSYCCCCFTTKQGRFGAVGILLAN